MISPRIIHPKPFPLPPGWRNEGRDLISRSKNIKQLINDALEVQDCLNTVKNLLAQLESNDFADKLVRLASECQDRFYDLLATSRDSASVLMAHLEDFTQNIVPLCQDASVSLSDKIIEVKGSAEMISATAHQSPLKTQGQLKELKVSLKHLEELADAHARELEIYAQAPMQKISEQIEVLENHLTHILEMRGGLLARAFNNLVVIQPSPELGVPLILDHPPSVSGSRLFSFLQDLFGACASIQLFLKYQSSVIDDTKELERRRRELRWWKREVGIKQIDTMKAIRGLQTAKQRFTVLDGKLGNFEDIWAKLMRDIKSLNDYLESRWSGAAEQEFQDRIRTESALYREIYGALEIYAIQSRRTQ
ncbi:hypothetical protein BDZ94DRAFT_1323697 [Collybia nuda]|uniref:Uncharacterized protein n=1 Tax=Collybia nuda TaxID=64659 RepID=A0A9P5Y276_9AGAR|nr:hypothetical protein BDZ94DRAFT_1323697 [Collybia nuda]